MNQHSDIEAAARAYLEAPEEEAGRFATGELAEFLELTRDVTEPVERTSTQIEIRSLRVTWAQGSEAEVELDATSRVRLDVADFGRDTQQTVFSGPVRLECVDGVWKVADITVNGRPWSSVVRLKARGSQQVDGLQISTVAVALAGDRTGAYLHIGNSRDSSTQFDWGAIGVGRRRGWRYVPLSLLPVVFTPGMKALVYVGAWKVLPLETRRLRLIFVEKGRRVGFDFVVELEPATEFEAAQRAPDALPLRLRLALSPLRFVPVLLPLGLVYWLGSWPSLGLTLMGAGGLGFLSLAWHRFKGRRFPVRRPAIFSSTLMGVGVAAILFAGLPFGGCPGRIEARKPADRFALALLTRGPKAAVAEMWSGTEPIQSELPRFRAVTMSRARGIVREGQQAHGASCEPFPIPLPSIPGVPDVRDEDCVVYGLPADVDTSSSSTGQLVVFVACHSRRWQVVGFG